MAQGPTYVVYALLVYALTAAQPLGASLNIASAGITALVAPD